MGICSGDVDFGVMVWIVGEIWQIFSDLEWVVNIVFGLLGIFGFFFDLWVLEQVWYEGYVCVCLVIKIFVYCIVCYIVGYVVVLQCFDGIIFIGGIGENLVLICWLVSEWLVVFGFVMDVVCNQQFNLVGECLIFVDGSWVCCVVIFINEECMIVFDVICLGWIYIVVVLV